MFLQSLIQFLLFSPLGWWILFLVVVSLGMPLAGRFRTWRRSLRFRAAQAAKLENPDNAEVRGDLAAIFLEGRRYAKAERYAREAVEAAGRNPLYEGVVPYRFLRLLGEALYHRRRHAESAEAFERALKAKSDVGYFDALLGLAKARLRLKQADAALEWARHAVRENSSALEGYFRWAQAAAEAGRADEVARARAEFWKVRATLPRFARRRRLWIALAFALFFVARRVG